ncbi:hypothetical protein IscW_ISCW002811 [Ixodes scapularis]|uniref:Uncharacterized protein n=1 Tax=Ixodes scapularis TaxID=6945 RepID=B7PCM4_IXOSC|nr:hypothetical protein IscW_ISCW002811 [Ixodes scapularis]|eukprot:XP_002410018.1 hypothetical protein IscW_ISCW002811 [Ixodes scapularis]
MIQTSSSAIRLPRHMRGPKLKGREANGCSAQSWRPSSSRLSQRSGRNWSARVKFSSSRLAT